MLSLQIKESANDVNSTPVTTGNEASVPPEAAESKVVSVSLLSQLA